MCVWDSWSRETSACMLIALKTLKEKDGEGEKEREERSLLEMERQRGRVQEAREGQKDKEVSKRKDMRAMASYRASSLMRLAHISKNSMVWLPGRGHISPPVESTEEVKEEAREPSACLAPPTGGVEGAEPSPIITSSEPFFSPLSFFRVVR